MPTADEFNGAAKILEEMLLDFDEVWKTLDGVAMDTGLGGESPVQMQATVRNRSFRRCAPWLAAAMILGSCGSATSTLPTTSSLVPPHETVGVNVTSPETSADGTSAVVRSRTPLPPSKCTMLYLPDPATPNYDSWAVEYPDGSTGSDFRSAAAAKMVQRCFYENGEVPTDATAFLLVGRFFWLGSTLRIIETESAAANLFADGGVSFVPPSIVHTDRGFTASFWAKETELTSLLWVEVEVTPEFVEYSTRRTRYGMFASSDDSYSRPRQSVPAGIDESELLSPPDRIRF